MQCDMMLLKSFVLQIHVYTVKQCCLNWEKVLQVSVCTLYTIWQFLYRFRIFSRNSLSICSLSIYSLSIYSIYICSRANETKSLKNQSLHYIFMRYYLHCKYSIDIHQWLIAPLSWQRIVTIWPSNQKQGKKGKTKGQRRLSTQHICALLKCKVAVASSGFL